MSRLIQDWIWFLSLKREQSFLGMLFLITDCMSFCAFKWSVFIFEIFFFHLSLVIIVSQPPMILSDQVFVKLFEIFDRHPKYQILIKVLLTPPTNLGCFKGPLENPKENPKLIGFILYVKLHGEHCPNSLFLVSDGITRLSPIFITATKQIGDRVLGSSAV